MNDNTQIKDNATNKGTIQFLKGITNRNHIIRENKDFVFIKIKQEGYGVWVDKRYVYPSNYTLSVSVSIVPNWSYDVKAIGDNNLPAKKISGYEFLSVLEA